jgi:hypothetical protein
VPLTKALIEAAALAADETSEAQELRDDKVLGLFVRVVGKTKAPVAFVRFSLGVGRSQSGSNARWAKSRSNIRSTARAGGHWNCPPPVSANSAL